MDSDTGETIRSGNANLPSILVFFRYFLSDQIIFPLFALPNYKKRTFLIQYTMSKVCEITGKKAIVGNNVSHSNTKTKRKFNVNLKVKKFYLPEEDKWITLRISTSALRTINKNGIAAVVKEAREKGFLKK